MICVHSVSLPTKQDHQRWGYSTVTHLEQPVYQAIWVKFLSAYKTSKLCHNFFFLSVFRQLRGVQHQQVLYILKIYVYANP